MAWAASITHGVGPRQCDDGLPRHPAEPETLSGRPCELIGVDRATIEQHLLRSHAGTATLLDRRIDLLGRGKSKVGDVIGDEATRPAAAAWRGQSGYAA